YDAGVLVAASTAAASTNPAIGFNLNMGTSRSVRSIACRDGARMQTGLGVRSGCGTVTKWLPVTGLTPAADPHPAATQVRVACGVGSGHQRRPDTTHRPAAGNGGRLLAGGDRQ